MTASSPYRTCVVNFDQLEHAIVDLNYAILAILDNIEGAEAISIILAVNELAAVHQAARDAQKTWVLPEGLSAEKKQALQKLLEASTRKAA
jgi:hypothetical protein